MTAALVLGGAACLWEDLAALGNLKKYMVFAINNAGVDYTGRIHHWVSLHPTFLIKKWQPLRTGNQDYQTWSEKEFPGIDNVLTPDWGGSSGLFAVQCALKVGCRNIVLAGVPMDPHMTHYHGDEQWWSAWNYRKAWMKHRNEIAPYVRSLSGWTREIFGGPAECRPGNEED